MKKILLPLFAVLTVSVLFAQSPQAFKYQAVVRDGSGEIIANQQVGMQISILQGSVGGTAVYTETHTVTTNDFGLINLNIGEGTTDGDFSAIDWSGNSYFVKTEMDTSGGTSYVEFGIIQLLSVPYALHAKTVQTYTETDPQVGSNTTDYISKWNGSALVTSSIFDNGNVGIGTESPNSKLEVNGKVIVTGGIDVSGSVITNLADPTAAQDAATKAYVEARIIELLLQQGIGSISDYDGNEYEIVKIGRQVWIAENLKVTHYRNGDTIPDGTGTGDISGETDPEYWFAYNDDLNNVSTYGRLYTWHTITDSRNVCPAGWHVPSDAECTTLETYLGDSSVTGGKMKETGTSHWNSPNTGATNESGFSGLPGGYRHNNGGFSNTGSHGLWWSSTEDDAAYAWYRLLYHDGANLGRYFGFKKSGFSVRCLKD